MGITSFFFTLGYTNIKGVDDVNRRILILTLKGKGKMDPLQRSTTVPKVFGN